MSLRVLIASAALSAVAFAGAAQAGVNIVQNPGFEDNAGALAPWTSATPGGWIDATFETGVNPNSGTHFAAAGAGANCTFAAPCALSQDLATTQGQLYDLTFAYNPGIGANNPGRADLKVYWGGALVDEIADGPNSWGSYTLTGLTGALTTTTLSFSAVQLLGPSGLDDVSVVAQAAVIPGPGVPEPATWALMLSGFAGVGASLRAARRRAAHA